MILELALILQVQVNQPQHDQILCPYYPLVDPPWRKYTCYILSRLGEPLDRPVWNYKGLSIPNEAATPSQREKCVMGREPLLTGGAS